MDGLAVLGATRPAWANLTALGFRGSTLGVRLVATASGSGDLVLVDRIQIGTIDYACTAGLSVGPIVEIGGGDYTLTVDSTAAQDAQLYCVWQVPPPPVEDQVLIDFVP